MTEIHGFCDERFAPLGDLFGRNLETGVDVGACLAVELAGEPVVDLWGGTSDWGLERPWQEDTLCLVMSTSKVVTIITLLLLYDRGGLDLDRPIAEYWPEFGQHGKDTVTTWQVLVHRSGLPGLGRPIAFEELQDFDHMVRQVESAELWYEPGTVTHYSFFISGFILGELVRRCSGSSFTEFFDAELRGPLSADFHFGLTDPADLERVADIWPAEIDEDEEEDPAFAELQQGNWLAPESLASLMPTVNGLTNARALARIGSVVASGGTVDGRTYLSPATIAEAGTEQSYEDGGFLGRCRFGLGWGLDSVEFPAPTPTTMHWGGYGGSFLAMDPGTGTSAAFVPNMFRVGEPGKPWCDRTRAFLDAMAEVASDLA